MYLPNKYQIYRNEVWEAILTMYFDSKNYETTLRYII